MSDSDSTWPAKDDFGSRFLEIDEFSTEVYETECDKPASMSNVLPQFRAFSAKAVSSSRPNTRGIRSRTYAFSEDFELDDPAEGSSGGQHPHTRKAAGRLSGRIKRSGNSTNTTTAVGKLEYDSEDSSGTGGSSTATRSPKLLTARQLSLQMQKHNNQSGNFPLAAVSPLLSQSSESRSAALTPEQIAAQELRAANRRESAKNKAELEKRQTVERLLKVNANSMSLHRGRGRGAAHMARKAVHQKLASTDASKQASGLAPAVDVVSIKSPTDRDSPLLPQTMSFSTKVATGDTGRSAAHSTAQQMLLSTVSVDPSPGYIRILSSSRLTPSTNVCVPPGDDLPLLSMSSTPPSPPSRSYCAMGCGRLRRYVCSKSGRPLCGLTCYQRLHAVC